MSWKDEFEKEFGDRKRQNCGEKYVKLLKDVIRPTFEDIERYLYEFSINVDINAEVLKVGYDSGIYFFSMKISLEDCKVKMEYSMVHPSEFLNDVPKWKDIKNNIFEMETISQEMLGEQFWEAIKPMLLIAFKGKS